MNSSTATSPHPRCTKPTTEHGPHAVYDRGVLVRCPGLDPDPLEYGAVAGVLAGAES